MSPSETTEIRKQVNEKIENLSQHIKQISHTIYENPELGLSEFKAVDFLTKELERYGYSIGKNEAGLSTAFRASKGNSEEPTVGLIAEYDALPDLGHACGHNIISASAVGAAICLADFLDITGGKVVVFGTPNEEGATAEGKNLTDIESQVRGKVKMVESGSFNGIDVVMEIHPYVKTTLSPDFLALIPIKISFTGKPAHAAAAPEMGINALDAIILTFNSINSLRQHLRSDTRIHGIITEGGEAPNIVPEKTSALFYLRASDKKYLDEVLMKVKKCAEGAALATGAKLDFHQSSYSLANMITNNTLCKFFEKNLIELGMEIDELDRHEHLGSSDIGNVSYVVPAIQPLIAVGEKDIAIHSREFGKATISKQGDQSLILATKALAFTFLDLMADKEIFHKIKMEHKESIQN